LVFYLVWNRGVFPAGDWSWMPFFSIFGHWTTLNQSILSIASMVSAAFLLWIAKRWKLSRILQTPTQC
jgi:hypothetical protein